MNYTKKDFILVTIIGFLVGWLVLLPVANSGFNITPLIILGSVLGFTIFAPIALFILKLLGKIWKIFEQFGKFAAVGTLNTLIDLGILNLFIYFTDISSGGLFSGFKVVSFLFATTNSYFWNKFWTFQNKMPVTGKEYARFFAFTTIGAAINTGVASVVVNVFGAPEGMDVKIWANVGALVAVFVSLIWNFLAYKLVVFKSSGETKKII